MRSTRPSAATSADIERVLGAIGGLSTQPQEVRGAVETLGDRTQATEIRLGELSAEMNDFRDMQDSQAHVLAEVRVLAKAPKFDKFEELSKRLRELEERPLAAPPTWPRASRSSTPSGPTTPPSGARTPPPPTTKPV